MRQQEDGSVLVFCYCQRGGQGNHDPDLDSARV
jgi:hypothetical protein